MEACYTTIHGGRNDSNFHVLPAVSNYNMVKKFKSFSLAIQFACFFFSSAEKVVRLTIKLKEKKDKLKFFSHYFMNLK